MFLDAWKEKPPRSPMAPQPFPFHWLAVFAGNGGQRVHVGGKPGEMDGHYRGRPLRDFGLDRLRREVQSGQVNIREDRHGVDPQHRRGRGDEGVGRDDHLHPRADAHSDEREFQGGGAIDTRDAEPRALEASERLLELAHPLAIPPLAALEDVEQGLALARVVDRPGRPRSGVSRLAAEEGGPSALVSARHLLALLTQQSPRGVARV